VSLLQELFLITAWHIHSVKPHIHFLRNQISGFYLSVACISYLLCSTFHRRGTPRQKGIQPNLAEDIEDKSIAAHLCWVGRVKPRFAIAPIGYRHAWCCLLLSGIRRLYKAWCSDLCLVRLGLLTNNVAWNTRDGNATFQVCGFGTLNVSSYFLHFLSSLCGIHFFCAWNYSYIMSDWPFWNSVKVVVLIRLVETIVSCRCELFAFSVNLPAHVR